MRQFDDLAIVGGGQSAKHLLLTLAHALAAGRLAAGLRIGVYEQGSACGPGEPWHPENVDEIHLSSLAAAVRRAAVGRDELQRFARIVAFLRELGAHVEVRQATRVIALDRDGRHWCLTDARGTARGAHHGVLAIGHSAFPMRGPDGVECVSPWPFAALCEQAAARAADGCLDVLVLGSYLTAVDVVTGLAARFGEERTRLRVRMLSRSGELPKVWGAEPRAIDADGLARRVLGTGIVEAQGRFGLAGFARMVLAAAHENEDTSACVASLDAWLRRLCMGDPARRLKHDLAETADGVALGWQAALFGCLPILSEAFPFFPDEDKLAFCALRSRYYRAAMPMAQENGRRLDALFDAGVLRVTAAPHGYRIRRPFGGGTAQLELADATGRLCPGGEYGLVVAAAGPDTRLSQTGSPLLRHLWRQGIVQAAYADGGGEPIELGGVRIDPASCEAIAAHALPAAADGRLFAMGPLVVGEFPDAQSIGHITRDAERIVERLVALQAASVAQSE